MKALALALMFLAQGKMPAKTYTTLARVEILDKDGTRPMNIPGDVKFGPMECHSNVVESSAGSGPVVSCGNVSALAMCRPDRPDRDENVLVITDKGKPVAFIHVMCVTIETTGV